MSGEPEQRLVIRVNSNLNWSRGKMAAHAVHAALKLYGIEYEHPVIVLGGKPAEILEQTVTVRDAGRTELEPGTLTAGASWSIPKCCCDQPRTLQPCGPCRCDDHDCCASSDRSVPLPYTEEPKQ